MAKARSRKPPGGPPALAGTLEQRVEDLRAHLRKALRSWDTDAIHQARVTTRRLKAAVDLLRPLLPADPVREFSKSLRKLRRTLGPLRDVDVMLEHLQEMKVPAGCSAGAEWVGARLSERRAALRRESARKLTPRKALSRLEAWVDLEQEVRDAQSAAGPLLVRAAPSQVAAFAEQADRIAGRRTAATAPRPAAGADSSDDVHALRVAGKLLRYTLELAAPLGCDVPRSVAKDFKALQEALGMWHDYVVLTAEMLRLAIDAHLPSRHPEVFGEVQELARLCWKRSERHLERFRTLWNESGAALADRVGAAFSTVPARADHANGEPSAPGESNDESNGESNGASTDEVTHSRPTHPHPS